MGPVNCDENSLVGEFRAPPHPRGLTRSDSKKRYLVLPLPSEKRERKERNTPVFSQNDRVGPA